MSEILSLFFEKIRVQTYLDENLELIHNHIPTKLQSNSRNVREDDFFL